MTELILIGWLMFVVGGIVGSWFKDDQWRQRIYDLYDAYPDRDEFVRELTAPEDTIRADLGP